jgi:hypothetical protein
VLADRGPLTVPDLLTSTRARLTELLHAIQDLQQFHLVEFLSDSHTVQLTSTGSRTATACHAQEIRSAASERLLGASSA